MKKIIVASTNQKIIDTAVKANSLFPTFFSSITMGDTDAVVSYINYEMPEIKILDYSSSGIDCEKIIETIHADSWLHYGGIIAVCENRDEVKKMEMVKDNNIIAVLTVSDFEHNFGRLLKILYQNQRFLFTRGMQDIIGGQEEGRFVCNNDPMDIRFYTNFLVNYLYNTNRISLEDRDGLQMTLMELLTNAVEHGNLDISYEEKTQWLMNGGDIMELLKKKSEDPKYKDRKIRISYAIHEKASAFRIEDDGDGFDWKAMLEKKSREAETHGRGISISRQYVKKLAYNEKGNQVTFSIANRINSANSIPGIMNTFEVINYKEKQVVCRQDEMSNNLFFIVSGQFGVFVNKKFNSTLTPNDMFIGEMAFLLNDRRTATVVALGNDCKLIRIPKTAFLSLIRKNPHYGIFLSKMLAQRLETQAQFTYAIQQKLSELQSESGKEDCADVPELQ
ncbi:MAG: cyclic nucleotide-binding domain-containing protein [Treponema sp.]|nr:cyclic nucleotide-binding domain-containing protein [Treponema sp.]